jgi:alpha-D-xyloside xylohydrolase
VKITHGAWLVAPGVTPTSVRRIHEYRIEGSTLWLAGVDRAGKEGANRFEGVILQMRVSSPMADVIRVQIKHHEAANPKPGGFDLNYELAASDVRIEDQKTHLTFTSGKLSLRISKEPFEASFITAEGAGSGGGGGGKENVITNGGKLGVCYATMEDGSAHLAQYLSLAVGECIYGMGERFGPLVKNGQKVAIWNEDGGTTSDLAYKSMPFYLSNRGYGVLVNTPGKVEFETATERVSQMQFSVESEELDYYLFHGPTPKEVLEKYTRLSGRPAVPPAWSFGLWLSTSFTTHYNEKTVNEFVDGMAKRGLPLSVFHFDCFWMKERHWCDFEWDADAFPDPAGMLKRLKSKGLHICLWINPYISQLSTLFDEGAKNGYLLKNKAGGVFQRDAWQPGMALVDFTNPKAVQWYCGRLRRLLDMGADCFKTDFGEFIPTDVVYHDGSDPALMHNYYSYLYNKSVFELLESYHGKQKAMVFARSATTGCQKFPVHWGGDCDATWESMAEDLRGGLSFCLSGAAFWSHDIGGFSGTANAALYKRWVAFGLLSTHSRLHGSESYRVPWLFDEESVDVMRHFIRQKNRLFPYLFAAAHEAGELGHPVMRAMMLEFQDDPTCNYLDRQYMLGSSLLVAPIFRQDNVSEYYLPAGRWTNLLSGEVLDGPQWRHDAMGFKQMPLFVRENTMLALSSDEEKPDWNLTDELTLNLYQIADGASASATVHATESQHPVTFQCHRAGAKFTLTSDGRASNVRVALPSRRTIGEIGNGKLRSAAGEGPVVSWNDSAKPLTFSLKD